MEYREAQRKALEFLVQSLEYMHRVQNDPLNTDPDKLDLAAEMVRTASETLQHLFWLETWAQAREKFGPGVFWGLTLRQPESSVHSLFVPLDHLLQGEDS